MSTPSCIPSGDQIVQRDWVEPGPSPFEPDKVLTMCPEYTLSYLVARGGQICRKQIWCATQPERSEGKGHGRPAANQPPTRGFSVQRW